MLRSPQGPDSRRSPAPVGGWPARPSRGQPQSPCRFVVPTHVGVNRLSYAGSSDNYSSPTPDSGTAIDPARPSTRTHHQSGPPDRPSRTRRQNRPVLIHPGPAPSDKQGGAQRAATAFWGASWAPGRCGGVPASGASDHPRRPWHAGSASRTLSWRLLSGTMTARESHVRRSWEYHHAEQRPR